MEDNVRTSTGYLQTRNSAGELLKDQTPAERRLWEVLRARKCGGLRFLRQRPFGQYIVDFYCPARRLAIEVDGSVHDEESVCAYDAMRQHALEEQGIALIRLQNEDVLAASDAELIARVLSALPPARLR